MGSNQEHSLRTQQQPDSSKQLSQQKAEQKQEKVQYGSTTGDRKATESKARVAERCKHVDEQS